MKIGNLFLSDLELLDMISSASAISEALSLKMNASILDFTSEYELHTSAIMKLRKIKDENITIITHKIQNRI